MKTVLSDLSSTSLREMFGRFPTGVAAVCAAVNGHTVGFAVSSFVGVSLEPPLVGIFVQRESQTWPALRQADSIGISFLGEAHGAFVGQMSSKLEDRFAGLPLRSGVLAAILLEDAVATMETTIFSETPAGDHIFVMLRIRAMATNPATSPLVFHQGNLSRLASAVN